MLNSIEERKKIIVPIKRSLMKIIENSIEAFPLCIISRVTMTDVFFPLWDRDELSGF